ncbi:MAG: hypothetical protein Q4C20_12600, partial [Erysipelotrichaceae bacterium]|nr:hypothetical protein [Erysipelotrichaceae bacterium]
NIKTVFTTVPNHIFMYMIQEFNLKLKEAEISYDDINAYWNDVCQSLIENHSCSLCGWCH